MNKHRTDRVMDQKEINKAEWANPDNWGGPRWISIYFSKKDSRTFVQKQIPLMGWTLNLAKTSGVILLISILIGLCLVPLLTLILLT